MKSSAPVLYSKRFRKILDLSKFPTYSKSAPISRVILRDSLADPVFEAGKLAYNKQFEKYEIVEEKGRERVRVCFADGSSDVGDILIGADGNHSKVKYLCLFIGLQDLTFIADQLAARLVQYPAARQPQMFHCEKRSSNIQISANAPRTPPKSISNLRGE
jgi:hypothetical protein